MGKNIEEFKKLIKRAEHSTTEGNIYQVKNSDGAHGAYQFLPEWENSIRDFAINEGYTFNTMDDFLNNSTLQDDFFEHYYEKELRPQMQTLKKYNDEAELTDDQLLAGIHFLGYPKMRKTLMDRKFDSPQSYSNSLNDYFERAGLAKAQSLEFEPSYSDFSIIDNPSLDFPTTTPADNTAVQLNVDEELQPVTGGQDPEFQPVLDAFFENFAKGGDKVGNKIRKLKKEGKSQDQAVAIALSMEERGKLQTGGMPPFPEKPTYLDEANLPQGMTLDQLQAHNKALKQNYKKAKKQWRWGVTNQQPTSADRLRQLNNMVKTKDNMEQGGMVRLDTFEDGGETGAGTTQASDGNFLVHRSSDFIYHSDQYPEMSSAPNKLYSSPIMSLPSSERYFQESFVGNTGASCTGAVCKATDDIMPRLGVPGLTQWKESKGFGSGSNHPYYDRYGESIDAWDMQGAIREAGGVANYTATDYNDIKDMPDEEFENMIKGFSVGTVLNYTVPNSERKGLNNENGMLGGTHSAVVVGFNEEGIPVIFDYGTYRLASKTAFDGAYKLVNASTPAEYADFTYDNLAQQGRLNKTFEGSPVKIDTSKLQGKLYSDEKTGQEFNEKRTNTFVKTLEDEKENLINDLENIGSNEEYDMLANMAVAIAMAESRGGKKTLGSTIDAVGIGDSVGMTQINEDTFWGKDEEGNLRDPVLADKVARYGITSKKDLFDDRKSALATMIYLSTVKNRAQNAHQKGLEAGERIYRADNSLKGQARGLDKITIEETGEKIMLPQQKGATNNAYKGRFENYLRENGLEDRYRVGKDDRGYYVAKKTVGNKPEMGLEEMIAYYWNTPSSLVSGDAQGGNEYVKKVLNYYNTLVE